MRRTRFLRIVLAVVAVAVPALANAPTDQYVQFDQDAAAVTDHYTNLTWDRYRVQRVPGNGASLYCSSSVFMSPIVGRVPTVKELLTLVDEVPHQSDVFDGTKYPLIAIDPNAFPSTPTDVPYWTSTPGTPTVGGNPTFWTVEFTSGTTALVDATTTLNVRCVY